MKTELYWIEDSWAGRLAIAARPRGGDWLDDETIAWQCAGVAQVVSLLTSDESADLDLTGEAEHCKARGISFLSFPIADRGVPSSRKSTFEFLKSIESALGQGKRIAIHCRQGIGRSALIAAALLVMAGVTPEAAFQRISAARGYPVPETAEQRAWVVEFAREIAIPTITK